MTKHNDGGPAFPSLKRWQADSSGCAANTGYYVKEMQEGMTLRDYFAAKASEEDILEFMPATVGDARKFKEQHGFEPTRQWARYQHAAAMLAARAERND